MSAEFKMIGGTRVRLVTAGHRANAAAEKKQRVNYGPPLWALLHRRALATNPGADDSEWLAGFRRRLPCGSCRRHWDEVTQAAPPDWSRYFAWTVDRHNDVNARLGKPNISHATAITIWSSI